MKARLITFAIIIGGLVCVNSYFLLSQASFAAPSGKAGLTAAEAFIAPPNQADYLPLYDASAGEVQLDAKSAIVYDLKADRNLFQKNTNDRLPIASLTKIVNAIVVWENLDPNDIVTVQPSAVKVDGQRQNLFSGEQISVNNLMQMMLIESSNDAAYALRDYAKTKGLDLVVEMNKKAAVLGMINTHFVDPAGLDDNGYSTTQDLAKAVHYALQYNAIWDFSLKKNATIVSADGKFSRDIKSTDELLGVLSDIVGGKTGYTDSALGCMILIVNTPDQNDTMVAILLGSHDRFGDMNKLVTWARHAYRWQ